MARFDWRSETLDTDHQALIAHLMLAADMADTAPATPKNGYTKGAKIVRGDHRLCEVWWEGNPGVHVMASGPDAPWLVETLSSLPCERRVTRTDACEDWVQAGLFDRLAASLLAYAADHGIKINQQGDWHNGQSRTLYLGARSSAGQLVLYEKGHQVGGDPDWIRLEARAYPKGCEARRRVTSWHPGQVFGATPWMAGALSAIGWDHIEAQRIGTVWAPSDTERARAALCKQYGKIIQSWAEDVGGWEHIGTVLRSRITEGA